MRPRKQPCNNNKGWHCTAPIFVLGQNPKSRVRQKIRTSQRSNSDDKGSVGQVTINTYAVHGILRYSLREIDHVKIDAVKGQASFLVEVKSQSKYLAGQKFDRGRRSEYRIY